MAWIYLTIAGLFRCAWVVGIKDTLSFTKLVPTLLRIAG